MLCLIVQGTGYGDRFRDVRMDKVPMAPLASAVHKTGTFEVSDELSHFRRH